MGLTETLFPIPKDMTQQLFIRPILQHHPDKHNHHHRHNHMHTAVRHSDTKQSLKAIPAVCNVSYLSEYTHHAFSPTWEGP